MTYTIFEYAKENADELMVNQPDSAPVVSPNHLSFRAHLFTFITFRIADDPEFTFKDLHLYAFRQKQQHNPLYGFLSIIYAI